MNRSNALLAVVLVLITFLHSEFSFAVSETTVTIYSSADVSSFDPQQYLNQARVDTENIGAVPGFGIVKQIREIELQSGNNELRFTDVAQGIDPTTVNISSETDRELGVLEQSYQFDLASAEKILSRYIDRDIKAVVQHGQQTETISGRLISGDPQSLVLQTADGIRLLNGPLPQLQLGELPGGLITKPTLVWKLSSKQSGKHRIKTSYQTSGLTWRADYSLSLDPTDTKANLNAWVTLLNLSGAGYDDTGLKLIAGDVQRIAAPPHVSLKKSMEEMEFDGATGFEEKSFGEYHLYTLPRRTSIRQNSTQQITLFPSASGIPVQKILVYYGTPEAANWLFDSPATDRSLGSDSLGSDSNKKIDVYIRFKNDKPSQLGIPLPKGKIRVYKEDPADSSLEFLGEDIIDHTPKDEEVLIKIGQAFDIVGDRSQTDFNANTREQSMTESFKIELRNHKEQEARVIIKENMWRWTSWEISAKSDPFEKIDARTVHFAVKVPPNGTKTVTYTVRYRW